MSDETDKKTVEQYPQWESVVSQRQVSRGSLRLTYEQTVTHASRLHTFSTSRVPMGDGPLEQRQNMLAHDDLILFAISVRRLIETTVKADPFKKLTFPKWNAPDAPHVKFVEIVNALLHNGALALVRNGLDARLLTPELGTEQALISAYLQGVAKRHVTFDPVVVVKSNGSKTMAFELKQAMDCFETDVLPPIVEYCAEKHRIHFDLDDLDD